MLGILQMIKMRNIICFSVIIKGINIYLYYFTSNACIKRITFAITARGELDGLEQQNIEDVIQWSVAELNPGPPGYADFLIEGMLRYSFFS